MALTFRTGSGGKGSALTIDELDNNFRHFTGSHTVSGSVTISGSINISGSIIPTEELATLGSKDNPFLELFVTNDSIIFVSGSTTSSFGVDSSGSLSGSFDGDFTGSFTGSGHITGSGTGSWDGDLTGSFTGSGEGDFTGSFSGSGHITGSGTGSWDWDLSGSFTGSAEGDFTGSFSGSGHITGSLTGSFTGSGLVTDITASGNISSSANVAGLSGSFTGLILTAPNGNQFKFTTDNSGNLSLTGSAV